MRSPRFLQRPLLISVSANRWRRDVLALGAWPSAHLLLNPGRDRKGEIPFFAAAVDPQLWPVGRRAALGASVTNDLHQAAAQAIGEIAQYRTEAPVLNGAQYNDDRRENGKALADWLIETISDRSRQSIAREVPYLFTSGAHRARAIVATLGRVAHRPILRLSDNGAAVGLISWLLSSDLLELQQVELFEPDARFRTPLERLWQQRRDGLSYSVAQLKSERAEYPAGVDLIMFCHCLLRIKPAQRAAVLERAWAALPPGGVLLVNEGLQDDSTPVPDRADMVHRDEMIAIMPGRPQLFREQTAWRTPEDLRAISAAAIGYSGIILSVRM